MKINNRSLIRKSSRPRILVILTCAAFCALGAPSFAQNDVSPSGGKENAAVTNGVGTTNAARQFIQEQGQAAVDKIQTLWQRIDEKRIKNRTPDQIVAMVVMGMLAGGLLYRFGGRGQVSSILLGLVGAFIGGMIANVSKLDLGLGPVLITYEDLLFTLLGAVLIICGVRWSSILKLFKPVK